MTENGDRAAGGGPSLWPTPAWLSFAWGFAESTLFFVIPDIILAWACLSGVKHGLKSLAAILTGAVLGGLLMFWSAVRWPDQSAWVVSSIPFVRDWMFADVSAAYDAHGALGMLLGPASGIPYKVYAILAPSHFDAITFALMSVPARLERLAANWAVFTVLGIVLRRWWPGHQRLIAWLFAGLWIAIYAWYWSAL